MKRSLFLAFSAITCLLGSQALAVDEPAKESPLTKQQAINRVIARHPVFACPKQADWFSTVPGECPNDPVALERVIAIKDGKALLAHGGFAPIHEQPTTLERHQDTREGAGH